MKIAPAAMLLAVSLLLEFGFIPADRPMGSGILVRWPITLWENIGSPLRLVGAFSSQTHVVWLNAWTLPDPGLTSPSSAQAAPARKNPTPLTIPIASGGQTDIRRVQTAGSRQPTWTSDELKLDILPTEDQPGSDVTTVTDSINPRPKPGEVVAPPDVR